MNKLFTKIAGLSLGLAMAIGVGVAVGSKEVAPVHASAAWQAHTGAITAGNEYLIVSVSGTYCMVPANTSSTGTTTKAAGGYSATSFTAASGPDMGFVFADAGSGNFYIKDGACFVRANGTTNNGLASATSNNTNPSYGTWIVTETSTSGEYTLINTNGTGRQISLYGTTNWRSYGTTSGSKTNVKLYEKAKTAQTITASADSAYSDESVTLTTNATSATWSITLGASYAHLSSTSGKSVSLVGDAAGSVTVKAVASGYTDATKTITFNERPTGTYYDVTFNSNGGSISPAKESIKENETFTFPSPGTQTHYSFLGWSSDGGTTKYATGATSPAVTSDITYTAYWQEDAKYTVTYVKGDHGTGSNYVVSNQYAGSYTLATFETAGFTADDGYKFSKWSVGGVQYAEGASITLSANTTVTAIYSEIVAYTLVTDPSTLKDGTEFVLVDYVSSTYRIAKDLNSGHIKMNTVTSATTVSGTTAGSTVETDEADVFTLVGSTGAWEIKRGDTFLQFTGTSNGNDSFTSTSSADTKFSIVTSSTSNKLTINSNSRSDRALRYNTSTGDLRNYANTGSQLDLYMYAIIPVSNELSSIALSGDYKTSFASGETFSFGGTVTASYTLNDPANVTSSTTFHLDSADGTNMSGVTMTHAAHDGHTIYAKYTEGGITKTATYSISVANAPVSSLTIASNTGKVATTELFDMSGIGVTILPADAVQTYEWTVLSNTVNNDFTFEADIVEAGNTEGTITLKCTSTADSSKYQTFVLTVSGNPVVSLPGSVTLYTGKTTTVTASVEGGTSPYTYSWSITSGGSYASISSGGSSATVTLSGSAAGSVTLQCSVTDSNSKSDSASVTFSVIASAVTSVSWSASAFDVFSGATIPSNIDDTWEVNYEKNNGDADYITFGDYELYLGSKEITSLPYTFVAEDDGESLHVEYGGISSSSVAVTVTQSINAVTASLTDSWDHTFTAKAWSAAGEWTISEKLWTMSGTDDGTPYFGYDATKGQQFGSGTHPFSDVSLQSSAFSGTIDSVTVYTSGANSINATVQVSVGGTAYGSAQTITNTNTAYTFDLGGKSGTISIDWVNSSSKAIYVKEIVVNTVSGSENIANNASHKAAQRAAVAFAQAFNAAMDETENCTTGLDDAWSTCSSAYTSFKSAAAALGSAEEAYAKNLIKYATAQYSDDSAEACIERMMKTYEVCVQKHGKTAFMSDLVTLGRISINPLQSSVKNSGTAIAIIAISAVSLAAIGGYFLFRKKKEN